MRSTTVMDSSWHGHMSKLNVLKGLTRLPDHGSDQWVTAAGAVRDQSCIHKSIHNMTHELMRELFSVLGCYYISAVISRSR